MPEQEDLPETASAGGLDPEWADNQTDLARILGLSTLNGRKTIQRWLQKGDSPGHTPEGRYHIAEWRAYALKHGRKAKLPDKAKAELESTLIENERNRLKLEVERGNLCSVDEVASLLAAASFGFANRLLGSKHELGPSVVGVTVPEATKRIGLAHETALTELAVPDWLKKKPGPIGKFWSKVSARQSVLQTIAAPGIGPNSTS